MGNQGIRRPGSEAEGTFGIFQPQRLVLQRENLEAQDGQESI